MKASQTIGNRGKVNRKSVREFFARKAAADKLAAEVIQATSFELSAARMRIAHRPGRSGAAFYDAKILNSDGSVLDERGSFNDFELMRWIASFGFAMPDDDAYSSARSRRLRAAAELFGAV